MGTNFVMYIYPLRLKPAPICKWCTVQFLPNHYSPLGQLAIEVHVADCTRLISERAACGLSSVHQSQTKALKLNGCSPRLFLWLGAAALWWLSSWNCMLLSGRALNSAFFFAPSGVCLTDISTPLLSRELCGLAAFIRLGFSFQQKFLWCCFFLLCLLCLVYKKQPKLTDLNCKSCLYCTNTKSFNTSNCLCRCRSTLTAGIHFPPKRLPHSGHVGGLWRVTYTNEHPGFRHLPRPLLVYVFTDCREEENKVMSLNCYNHTYWSGFSNLDNDIL